MPSDCSQSVQDLRQPDPFGGVNPAINDSSTFAFPDAEAMERAFGDNPEGRYLYARHWTPTTRALSAALARMADSEAALVTGSGMAAISTTLLQLCETGDEIVSSRTIYGATYALMHDFLPGLGIRTHFVDITRPELVEQAITSRTRVLYCEGLSNPLLEVSDIPALADIAARHEIPLIVDNTFAPLILSPIGLGAQIEIHSLTKFINGTSDGVGGCVCATEEMVQRLLDMKTGAAWLLGPILDSQRAASILKNLHSLPLRMRQHSHNAAFISRELTNLGLRVHYPGLTEHPQHDLMRRQMNPTYGYGGILALDTGSEAGARRLVRAMAETGVGYAAVSLGYFTTLFSLPGSSTSSEIPPAERAAMGLTDGLVRLSMGLDTDIAQVFERLQEALDRADVLGTVSHVV